MNSNFDLDKTECVFLAGGEVIGGRPEFVNWGIGWYLLKLVSIKSRIKSFPDLLQVIAKDQKVDVVDNPVFMTSYFPIENFGIREEDIPNKGVWNAVKKAIKKGV